MPRRWKHINIQELHTALEQRVIGHRLVYCAARLLQIAEPCRHMGLASSMHCTHSARSCSVAVSCVGSRAGIAFLTEGSFRRRSLEALRVQNWVVCFVHSSISRLLELQLGLRVTNQACWASWKAHSRPPIMANLGGGSAVYKKKPKSPKMALATSGPGQCTIIADGLLVACRT